MNRCSRLGSLLAVSWLFVGLLGCHGSSPSHVTPNALQRSMERYRALQVYDGAGDIRLDAIDDPNASPCLRFTTSYQRKKRLTFHFEDRCDRTSVDLSYEGDVTKVTTTLRSGERNTKERQGFRGFVDSVEAIAGVTYGSSRYLPGLLLGLDPFGLNGPNVEISAPEIVSCGFESCYLITVRQDPYNRRMITIDRNLVVRGLRDEEQRAGKTSSAIVRFQPVRMK